MLLLEDPNLTVTVPSPVGAVQIIGLRCCSPSPTMYDDPTVLVKVVLDEAEDVSHPFVLQ